MMATTDQSGSSRPIDARQHAALIGLVVLAGVIGTWSYVWPRHFFDRFPVVLGAWIAQDGPFNEHLARDHGAMYLALGAAGAYALVRRAVPVQRALGVAWTVFGTLHAAYHVAHLGHLSTAQATGQVAALVTTVVLGLAVMVPGGTRRGQAPHARPRHPETLQVPTTPAGPTVEG